jgi:hypothetical protein
MQALSTSGRSDAYDPHLRELFQRRVAGWIAETTRLSSRESKTVAGVALMAFDGFAMNVHLPVGIVCNTATARLMARTLIGS